MLSDPQKTIAASLAPELVMIARAYVEFLTDLESTHCGLDDFSRTWPALPDSLAEARRVLALIGGEA